MSVPQPVRGVLFAIVLCPWAANASVMQPVDECVILLHGLFRSKYSMKAVEWKLIGQGYRVVNFSYPSIIYPIEKLAVTAVEAGLKRCREQGSTRISFVTHSLGGILLRQYLAEHKIRELHRVVMLAPPNQGSQMADYLNSMSALKYIRPRAVGQLGTDSHSIPQQLGPVDFELGVIAGTTNRRPFTPGAPPGTSDGTVAVVETGIEGMQDFIELPATHTFMMWRRAVLEQVVFFLRNGQFLHVNKSPSAAP